MCFIIQKWLNKSIYTHTCAYIVGIISSYCNLSLILLKFQMIDDSSGFVLCFMSLQMLWSEWLQLLKCIPCYNPKYVRYRDLAILIFFWANSYFTNSIFFDPLWSLPLVFTIYLVSLLKLECSLQVVSILCLGITKVRKKTDSVSLFLSFYQGKSISEKHLQT